MIELEEKQNLFEVCATRQAEWLSSSSLVAVDDGATFGKLKFFRSGLMSLRRLRSILIFRNWK